MLTSDYPYTATKGKCVFNEEKAVKFGELELSSVKRDDEKALADSIYNHGPASISIDASHHSFMLYKSGIYDEPECSPYILDHAVGCVGYGTEGSVDYWIIRNSYGTVWGEDGYIRMIRNKNNQCGIASEAYNVRIR